MKASDFLAIALTVFVLFYQGGTKNPNTNPLPQPDAAARSAVSAVSTLLAGHKGEAAQLAAFYHAAAEIVRRDGEGERVLTSTQQLRTFCQRAVTLRFQGVFTKIPGLADAIHGSQGALAVLLGLDVKELNHAQAAAALDAVAWAAQEASR
jgi:hypothetical protein